MNTSWKTGWREAYLGPCQTFMIELATKIVNGFYPLTLYVLWSKGLTIFAKSFIIDVWLILNILEIYEKWSLNFYIKKSSNIWSFLVMNFCQQGIISDIYENVLNKLKCVGKVTAIYFQNFYSFLETFMKIKSFQKLFGSFYKN